MAIRGDYSVVFIYSKSVSWFNWLELSALV